MVNAPLTVVIVGLGYVGVTGAACITSQGHRVIGVDVNSEKVASINAGRSPIVEPGVEEMLADAVAQGRLSAVSSIPALDEVDLVIVCVGTPSGPDGSHNMSFIAESARQIARAAQRAPRVTVAFRSTFRPGTIDELVSPIFADALGARFGDRIELVYNPEFLRESTAVEDYFNPPKIVIGTIDGGPSECMTRLHEGIHAPTFHTTFREAEVTKFIDNTWHAVKVAFANEIGRICAAYGVDSAVAHQVFVSDSKLNISPYYLRPGGAFGGSCLPKDVRAMQYIARDRHVDGPLIQSLLESNEAHKHFQMERVERAVRPRGRILVVGLAFKAGTDDLRESPNVTLVRGLIQRGYQVRVFDPDVQTSALVGQNLGHISAELPELREILASADEASALTFDLVVVNSSRVSQIDVGAAPLLDLRSIGTSDPIHGAVA